MPIITVMEENYFKDKNVLLIGLGILGGGVSISNWLLNQGARLSVFDQKNREFLENSIKQINGETRFLFGSCDKREIENADIIVINQAVPMTNPEVQIAEKLNKPIYNESRIFYENCNKPIIAITGTRGKTTTTNWTAHLLGKKSLIAGNSTEEPLLKILPETKSDYCEIIVNEIPSFQLERFSHSPSVAVITNIFVDHLNRHGTLENYALVKGNIFKYQEENDKLVLNYDNDWTEFYLKQNPRAEVWLFSTNKLPKDKNGIYYYKGYIYLQSKNKIQKIINAKKFISSWGIHNLANLEAAILAAHLAGEKITDIKKKISSLPQIKFRQETVYKKKSLEIINDTAATSPEGGTAAVERFGSKNCILITGGTDAGLDYNDWAKRITKIIPAENFVMLSGSATKKMLSSLRNFLDTTKIVEKEKLDDCLDTALEKISKIKKGKKIILFSPSAKSFEKFKNEFDRGEKFNDLIKMKFK